MKYNTGSTLIEILMYIALYSILFTGFMSFVFSMQKILISYQTKYIEIYEIAMIKMLLVSYTDRESEYQVFENSIVFKSGRIFNKEYVNRLLDVPIEYISCVKHERVLECAVGIHKIKYGINIHLL